MKSSFRLKTILGIAFIEAVLLSILLYNGLRYVTQTSENEFDQRSQATVKAFSVAAKGALITSDIGALEALTTEMLTYPGVVYARIRDANGVELSSAGDIKAAQHPGPVGQNMGNVTDGVFHIQSTVKEAATSFGQIELGLSIQSLKAMQTDARDHGLLLAGLEMILVSLFSWFLGSYLTRQLRALKEASQAVGNGDFQYTIPVQGKDELADTARAFNQMSGRLRDFYNELQKNESDMRMVFNATGDGLIVTDATGSVLSMGNGASKMLGWKEADALHCTLIQVLSTTPSAELEHFVSAALLATDIPWVTQQRAFEVVTHKGDRLWISICINEMGTAGTARRFLTVLHDITAEKETEFTLREAQKAAELTAQAKTEFLARMSHELRTPLHGVLASIEMLGDTTLNTQQGRMVQTARTSAELLMNVIDEILDFSRLEAGKLRVESLDFDPRRVIEDVSALMAARAHLKNIELAVYIAPEVPARIVSDPIRLRQILVNLIGNAIKFTDKGEVVVNVLTEESMGKHNIRIEVRDTGIGIEKSKIADLFEPFIQADSSTSRRFGGTGLGLSIVKRLVSLLQGQLGVESVPGTGSKFSFTLPINIPRSIRATGRSASITGMRILVVDDNSTNRVILHRYISNWGGESGSATSGDEALAMLQDAHNCGRPYQLLLLDMNMPGMNGYELLKLIQADSALRETPAIMLSSSMQDANKLQSVRVDVWLDKPVRQSDLHDAITTTMQPGKEHKPAAIEPVAAPLPAKTPISFDRQLVLLVEDNLITRDLGVALLRRANLQVETAETGVEAVEAVRSKKHAVILMDVQMPVMDGMEATTQIRKLELELQRGHTPIIALTAHAQPSDKEKCLLAGMDDYLTKPYSALSLTEILHRWLANDRPPGNNLGNLEPPRDAAEGNAQDAELIADDRLEMVKSVLGHDFIPSLEKALTKLESDFLQLSQYMSHPDPLKARDVAHSIKNTAGDLGASALHVFIAKLEAQLRENRIDSTQLSGLERLISKTKDALRQRTSMAGE